MKFYILAMVIFSMPTFASDQVPDFNQQGKSEWKLLGPAFSKHASLNGAPIIKQGTFSKNCLITTVAEMYYPDTNCVTSIVAEKRQWSETNPAFGIERRVLSGDGKSTNKLFVSFAKDSYGSNSLMLGAGKQWPLASSGTFQLNGGVAGGLWNRTMAVKGNASETCGTTRHDFINSDSYSTLGYCVASDSPLAAPVTSLKRITVPFVLPYLEIVEQRTGLGINLALAPKFKIGNYYTVPTTTLMIQFTYRMNF